MDTHDDSLFEGAAAAEDDGLSGLFTGPQLDFLGECIGELMNDLRVEFRNWSLKHATDLFQHQTRMWNALDNKLEHELREMGRVELLREIHTLRKEITSLKRSLSRAKTVSIHDGS